MVLAIVLALITCAAAAQSPERAPAAQKRTDEAERAIHEFRVQTRNLGMRGESVQQSAGAGAAASKAAWHGRLYEYFRNDILDATPHEARQRNDRESILRRNQFGFSVAGPVVIPGLLRRGGGTFFTLTFEGVRESISRADLYTLPTVPERAGDYSSVVDPAGRPLPVYDPSSTRPNPGFNPGAPVSRANLQYLRDPFPGNRLPAARLDPVAQSALAYYPRPNASVGPFFRNNYYINSAETNAANGVIARLDQSIGERHRVFVDLAFSNGFLGAAREYATAANPGPADQHARSRKAALEHTFTYSSQTVNRISFQAESTVARKGDEANAIDLAGAIGLRGAGREFFPAIDVQPYLGMGQPYPRAIDANNTYTWSEALSTRRGSHNLAASLTHTRYQVNSFGSQYPAGSFRFGAGLTGLPGIVNTGHAFASFLLGLSEYARSSIVLSPSYFRRNSTRFSLKDDWQARKDFTVTFMLNVKHETPRVEKYDRQSTVDLSVINPENGRPGALIVAGRDGRAFRPVAVILAPGLGIAWNPFGDSRTVVRSSIQGGAAPVPLSQNQWATQAFRAFPTYISPNVQLEPAVTLSGGLPVYPRPIPDLRPEAANFTVADLMDRSGLHPFYLDIDFSVERQLTGSLVASARLLAAGGRNLPAGNGDANPNAIPLSYLGFRDRLNDEAFNRSLRPYPHYDGFDVGNNYPLGQNRISALTLRLEGRGSGGRSFLVTYEFKKTTDDITGPYGTQDFYNRRNEWSTAATNIRRRFQANYVYDLPVGAGRRFLTAPGWWQHVVGGWSVIGTGLLQTGKPLALRPQFNNTGGVIRSLRVNVVPGVSPFVDQPGAAQWFNPLAFEQPPDFTPGNASRTHPNLLNPGMQNYDFSLSKRIPAGDNRTLEFTTAAFNVLNHGNWNEPDNVIGPASAPNVNAGRIIGSRGNRVVQLGLRFNF